jgi:rare lipoprotein A
MGAALAGLSITPLFPAVSAASRTAATISPAPFAPTLSAPVAVVKAVKHKSPLARLTSPLAGLASWYGTVLHGHHSADGEIFDENLMTAAHQTLPFGTRVRVVDVTTGRSVIVKITDRGILSPGRVIDLSSAAAESLGILSQGVARVRLEVLKREASVDVGATE